MQVRIETHYACERPQNEASVRSYNRDCSMQQKKKMSDTLLSGYPKIHNFKSQHSTVVPRVPSAEIEETVTPARNVQNLALQSSCLRGSYPIPHSPIVSSTSEIIRNSFLKFDSTSHNKHDCDMALLDYARRIALLREAAILNVL